MGDESGEANHVFANAKPLEQEQNVEVRFVEHKKKNDEKEGQQQKDIFIDLTMGGKETRTKSFGARVDKVSLFSFVSFAWMFGWMWRAYKGRVNTDPGLSAQWTCSIFDSANVNVKRLEHLWNEEKGAAARSAPDSAPLRRPPSLVRAVLRFLAHRLALAALVFLFCIVFGFIGPTCLVRGLVAFAERPPLQNGEQGKWTDGGQQRIDRSQGLWLALTLLVVEIFRVLAYGATWAIGYRTAIRTRSAVLGLLYETLLSAKTIRGKTPAEIVNIFANDGQRIFDAVTFAPLVLVGPFVLIGGLFYLLRVIGPLSLLAIAVFFAFDFIQGVLGVVLVKCRNLAVAQTEKRMARIGELIHCIKTIKPSWEELFFRRFCEVREREQHYLQIAGYTQSLMIAASALVPSVTTIVMVLAIVLNGHDLRESDIATLTGRIDSEIDVANNGNLLQIADVITEFMREQGLNDAPFITNNQWSANGVRDHLGQQLDRIAENLQLVRELLQRVVGNVTVMNTCEEVSVRRNIGNNQQYQPFLSSCSTKLSSL